MNVMMKVGTVQKGKTTEIKKSRHQSHRQPTTHQSPATHKPSTITFYHLS
jgi:hypothetical protein